MALHDDLEKEAARIFRDQWTDREGQTVPDPENIKLTNDAVHFKQATVLYADLAGSTKMVDRFYWYFSAQVYRAYLHCAARIIRNEGGEITAYDGDRVMGVFIGGSQCSNAARCGLKINHAVLKIINPAIKNQYETTFELKQVVGIDTSKVHVARTGVRGDNDLVWVGRAPNYAAKLTELDANYSTWITKAVFDRLRDKIKYGGKHKTLMWEARTWTAMNKMSIYCSSWKWPV